MVYTGEWYELLPLWQGVESMRRLVNLIIRDRTPRSPKTNRLYKEMLAQMDDSLNENPAKASRLAALQSSAESDERLDQLVTWDINKERGKDLLIAFWSAPDEWLSRLRRCKYLRWQRFFFDSSLDKHGKYCTDRSCRVLSLESEGKTVRGPLS